MRPIEAAIFMKIHLHFFAALREQLETGAESVELPPDVRTVGDVRHWLAHRGGCWSDALDQGRNVRAALDRHMVKDDAVVHDGAEVAFFPPVTGG